ncbi:MAG: hypothetical protein R6U98_32645, partial [Pirellulaceae bacterium]
MLWRLEGIVQRHGLQVPVFGFGTHGLREVDALLHQLAVRLDIQVPFAELGDLALFLAHHHRHAGLAHPGKLALPEQLILLVQRLFLSQLANSLLKGTGLLDEDIEEVIPLRLNGTYQTRRYWKTLDEFLVLHASEDAKISISVFPFREAPVANDREIAVGIDGVERTRFYSMYSYSWGSTLI